MSLQVDDALCLTGRSVYTPGGSVGGGVYAFDGSARGVVEVAEGSVPGEGFGGGTCH